MTGSTPTRSRTSCGAASSGCKPQYPYDATLNPNALRADWLIKGTYVEAAGLTARPEYAQKIETKRAIASAHGLDLIVVHPKDLGRLDALFARWLPAAR